MAAAGVWREAQGWYVQTTEIDAGRAQGCFAHMGRRVASVKNTPR
jgi:hypothetical protein